MVSGWFKGETTALEEHWLHHDERYRCSEELVRAMRGIWTEDDSTPAVDFYRIRDFYLAPKPVDVPGAPRDLPGRQLHRRAG